MTAKEYSDPWKGCPLIIRIILTPFAWAYGKLKIMLKVEDERNLCPHFNVEGHSACNLLPHETPCDRYCLKLRRYP